MQTMTIGFNNVATEEKILWLLEHFKEDGVEILKQEDLADLRAITATRGQETVSLEDYLKNEG